MTSTLLVHDIRDADFLEEGSLRVLHLVSSGGLYGAEQVVLNLARARHVVAYVGALHNTHSPNVDMIDEARRRGLKTVLFDSRGRVDLRTVFQISRFLKTERIDILHTHGYKSDIVGCLAATVAQTRWVATNHVWHPLTAKLRLYVSLDAFLLRFARRVVAVSSEIRQDLISTKVAPAKIRVIDNGIDVDRFRRPQPTDTLKSSLRIGKRDTVVTIVGRLSPEKGHKAFLEAARRVSSNRDHVKFLIVGDGALLADLRTEAARLKLQERVVFTGFRTDMPEIYAITDVLVNASSIEGLPMTILEAMASRVPVIATRIGGVPDIIRDQETGLLFDAGDVDALTTRMESLVDDAAERLRLAAAALEFVTMNHSFQRMCDAYWKVYCEMMDGERRHVQS